MEVATTSNHNQSHLHHMAHRMPHQQQHQHHYEQQHRLSTGQHASTDVSGARSPFQREVREWQRIDPDTGALLSGRLEADRWINGPLHSYGKISDSQNISQPNGTQQTQRKQLEVLQARTAGGAMQVIRAQTVQTTSSRWSSTSASASASASSTSSPVMMTNGGTGVLNSGGGSFRGLLHNHNSHFRSAASAPHVAETRWLQMPSTVDICEVSDGDDDGDADAAYAAEVDSDADVDVNVDDGADELNERQHSYLINSDRHKTINNNNNNSSSSSRHHSNSSKSFSHKRSSHLSNCCGDSSRSTSTARRSSRNNCEAQSLLLDTAPSLKLSNLMKSNSSLSSNNSSSNNSISTTTTAATATANTYKSAGKVSLHAIVGSNTNNNTSDTKSPTSTAMSSSLWQQQQQPQQQQQSQRNSSRLYEQPTLYGNSNNLTKSRVGAAVDCDEAVAAATAGDAAGSFADDVQRGCSQRHRQHQPHAELTPTQLRRQPRRDLESFRHYGEAESVAAADPTTTTTTTASIGAFGGSDADSDGDDDDDLCLAQRHHRRQQSPFSVSAKLLTRSRSISTDDLSTEWDTHGDHTEAPSEWRRVSKLRRSFQNSSSNGSEPQYSTPLATRRPLDLPTNSVSVSKIRAELENGRRLYTAMRNNHVDLAALDSILNAPKESSASGTQRSSFLTAESLKEIRGRLKKLSDESLYKDDFIAYQQPPAAEELIEVQHVRRKSPTETRLQQLTPEQSPEISSPKSAFHSVAVRPKTLTTTSSGYMAQRAPTTTERQSTHTNSLESRQKYKDTSSSEWHLRRKSYGFEKMSPPDNKSMFRMDASTDSGLGRSGELANWSPTADQAAPSARGTVIHFGDRSNAAAAQRYHSLKSPTENAGDEELLKRHSIAVDESQYVRKTSQVRLNGFYDAAETRGKTTANTDTTTATTLFQRTQQKRVEFCKTEVHFAAESGRVNIVETDGKPPPTNNFRRRRRTSSGPLQSLVKGPVGGADSSATVGVAVPITHFGDIQRNKTVTASTMVACKAGLVEASNDDDDDSVEPSNVTVSLPKVRDTFVESTRSSYASTTSGVDTTTDNETDEISAIRGILKNKPIKPKPYHLGENIDSADALWGVQLKPVGGGGSALTARRDGEVSPSSAATNKSVAERVRIVEKRQDHANTSQSNGYSTKINLSLDDTQADWPESGTQNLSARRPSAQELLLQDLREHQRILGEGLKSTSLIIKTMRSANEFDEAMRRLSIASLEAAIIPPIIVPTPMLRSNSYHESTARRFSNTSSLAEVNGDSSSTISISSRFSTDTHSSFVQPTAAPRFKLFDNTEIPVSQQLSQLRRMYEVATSQDDDSADEEVKRYFAPYNENSDSGGGTQDSSSLEDEHCIEYSSSWSRLKAKRTIWQIETDERKSARVLERTELPTSNVMSIELHSPQTLIERRDSVKRNQTPPIAKPRTIANIKSSDHPTIHTATTVKQSTHQIGEPTKESLKIVKEARGARKLREHELSYFGVHISKSDANDTKTKLLPSKRSLPQRKLIEDHPMTTTTPTTTTTTTTMINKTPMSAVSRNETKAQTITKWQLLNDKPDLLRHSPIAVEPQLITRVADIKPKERRSQQQTSLRRKQFNDRADEEDEDALDIESQDDEHLYENITNEITPVFKVKSSNSYDRKRDLQRDALILSEMTKNADQTLKALSDEAAFKDQRRRSLQRRNPKPLETIDEKSIAEKINDSCIAVKVTRGTFASEAKRSSRHSTPSPTAAPAHNRTRTSSLSSVESCPHTRSRSLSSEREYENIQVKANRSKSKPARLTSGQRSSSRESQGSAHVTYSSGDEVCKAEREQRLRSKHAKRSTASSSQQAKEHKHTAPTTRDRHHQQQRTQHDHPQHRVSDQAAVKDGEKQRAAHSSTTHSSQREERAECNRSGSGRRRRDEHELPKSTRTADKKQEHTSSHLSGTGARLLRSLRGRKDESSAHRSSTHRSSTRRSEHADKEREREKEKEKLSKSKGHSSRSTTTHSSERHATSQHGNSSPSKLREHKKATASNIESKPHEHTTHSKNAQIAKGQVDDGKQHHPQQKQQQQQKQHHQHAPQEVIISKTRKERK